MPQDTTIHTLSQSPLCEGVNKLVTTKYGYRCVYCQGTVQPRYVEREAFKHKNGFVILEHITIGVCDVCGNRYYSADILHAVHEHSDWQKSCRTHGTSPRGTPC